MGFMGLSSVCESDNAADLGYRVSDAVTKILKEGLKQTANEYNTSGPINVALIFEALIIPAKSSTYILDEKLVKIAQECILLLKKEKAKVGSFDRDYTRMIKSLTKFVKDVQN